MCNQSLPNRQDIDMCVISISSATAENKKQTYIYTWTYTCMHTYKSIHTYIFMYICLHTCIGMFVLTYMWTKVSKFMRTGMLEYVCICVYTCTFYITGICP